MKKEELSFIEKYKWYIIGVILTVVMFATSTVLGGNPSINTSGAVDASKKVDSTVSSDTLGEGATKLGNIGAIGGDLDLSKHNDSSKK